MEDGSKRLKIDDDLLFSEEARRVMSTDFCVPCGKSYSFTQKREYWIHMIGHTRVSNRLHEIS
jgi:hypothetical protein